MLVWAPLSGILFALVGSSRSQDFRNPLSQSECILLSSQYLRREILRTEEPGTCLSRRKTETVLHGHASVTHCLGVYSGPLKNYFEFQQSVAPFR